MQFFKFFAGLLLALAVAAPVAADGASEVILTVRDDTGEVSFTLDDLREMPQTVVVTRTIWTTGVQEFTGVPLHLLVEKLELSEGSLRARAVNDYAVDIPVEDALEEGPVIAYLWNGEEMSVRDKGPLWIIYPYDADPIYRTEMAYSRSIWHLVEIEVIK